MSDYLTLHPADSTPPREVLLRWLPHAVAGDLLRVDFSLAQYWLEDSPAIDLVALYLADGEGGVAAYSVSNAFDQPADEMSGEAQFRSWCDAASTPMLVPDNVLGLSPHIEPKPWGREVWFSGVERRGLSQFRSGDLALPIPWVLAAMPGSHVPERLVLLKILDPLAEEVRGDLYYELHREKREVYVVTHVDTGAWPDGTGYIRYGFNQELRAEYRDDEAFRTAYLTAVDAYEAVRRTIDSQQDAGEESAEALYQEERELRAAMNRFSAMRPLQVGDVVSVPLDTPHSLQHGVRTIEFQTPVYERLILSFAQKVLTQDHWDTRAAMAVAHLDTPQEPAFKVLESGDGVLVERIVDFEDFSVDRVRLDVGAGWHLSAGSDYALGMMVSGELVLEGQVFAPEQAFFLPADYQCQLSEGGAEHPRVFLLARPRI